MIYPAAIHLIFGAKYKGFMYDVRDIQDKIFHMKDGLICMANFEQVSSDTSLICHPLKSVKVFHIY